MVYQESTKHEGGRGAIQRGDPRAIYALLSLRSPKTGTARVRCVRHTDTQHDISRALIKKKQFLIRVYASVGRVIDL